MCECYVIAIAYLPANLLERHWPGELVEETTSSNSEVGEGHALGALLEAEHLDGVERLKRCQANGEDNGEDVDLVARSAKLGLAYTEGDDEP